MENKYHSKLRKLMDTLIDSIYDLSEDFPRKEMFGLTSQIRRASLSIVLNYVEGYARQRKNVLKNFLEISYGSLKETEYLIYFAHKRKYITDKDYNNLSLLTDEVGRMIWGISSKI